MDSRFLRAPIKSDKMPAVRGDGMRGLAVFISDIRNCKFNSIVTLNSIGGATLATSAVTIYEYLPSYDFNDLLLLY